jgi:hypothetical protein
MKRWRMRGKIVVKSIFQALNYCAATGTAGESENSLSAV